MKKKLYKPRLTFEQIQQSM